MDAPRTRPAVVPRIEGAVFAVWCEDAPDGARLRRDHLDAHLAHVERNHDRFLAAGPLRGDGGPALVGSLFIVSARDEGDARALMAGDPYFACGAYARVTYRAFTPAAGRWMGGVIWESAESLRAVADGGRG